MSLDPEVGWIDLCFLGQDLPHSFGGSLHVRCSISIIGLSSAWRWVPFGLMVLCYLWIYSELGRKRPKIGEIITANVYRYKWEFTRKVMLLMTPAIVVVCIVRIKIIPDLTYAMALYFLAVDDLPSQPSKLRLWLESLTSEPLPSDASARSPHGQRT